MSLLLAGGTVVTSLDLPSMVPADVVVDEGRIVAQRGRAGTTERIDCTGCLVIPGNVCTHHHVYSALARGMPYRLEPPRDFVETLQRVWWRLDRALDLATIASCARSAAADALLAGTTTIIDHHASPNAIEGSLDTLDMWLDRPRVRRILCYEVTDRDGSERAAAGLAETGRQLKQADVDEARRISRTMVGAHASFTLSDETLRACVALADEFDVGIHIHVAEDAADQRDAQARFGRRVVERLADAGALNERSLLAHCVHVDDREVGLIRDAGAWIAHNARSNMNNRVGRAAVSRLGERVTLGTDGLDGDMFAEAKAAFWRGREDDPSITPTWILGRLAAGAAFAGQAFGEPLLGRIEPGAPADLVVLDYDPSTPMTAENLAGHWVFGISANHVRDVVVDGRVVVRGRRLEAGDPEGARAIAQAQAQALWERLDAIEPHPFGPDGAGET